MDLLFKVVDPVDATRPKVGESNFKKHYPGANKNMSWETLEPFIRQATQKYVIPYIGRDQYDDWAEAFQNDDIVLQLAEVKEPMEMLQDAIAHYTIFHAAAKLNVTVTDMGAQQNSSSEGTSTPPSQLAFKTLRWDALKDADNFLDTTLQEMEKQVLAGINFYNPWKDSAEYNFKKNNFFRHTHELDEFLNIQGSFRSFVALTKYLTKAEEKYLLSILGADQIKLLFNNVDDYPQWQLGDYYIDSQTGSGCNVIAEDKGGVWL